MTTLPTALFWHRVDQPGADHVLLDDRLGLHARGLCLAAVPTPFSCRYELFTDGSWGTAHLEVCTEGAGWRRTARLERAAGRWRVTSTEQGDLNGVLRAAGRPAVAPPGTEQWPPLAGALDVHLAGVPLSYTLPVRRLGLLDARTGTGHTITVVWVRLPDLLVSAVQVSYLRLSGGRIRFTCGSGPARDLDLDAHGFPLRVPGFAQRAPGGSTLGTTVLGGAPLAAVVPGGGATMDPATPDGARAGGADRPGVPQQQPRTGG